MDSTLDGFSLPELGWDWAAAFAQCQQPLDTLHNSMNNETNSIDFHFDPLSAAVATPTLELGLTAPAALDDQAPRGIEIDWNILADDCFVQCFTTTATPFVKITTSEARLGERTHDLIGYKGPQPIELSVQELATIEDLLNRAADSRTTESWAEADALGVQEDHQTPFKEGETSGTYSSQGDALGGAPHNSQPLPNIDAVVAEERRGYPYWGAEHSDNPPLHVSTPIPRRDQGLHILKDPKPGERPAYNLRTLIKMAILGCPDQRLQIDQIFEQIMGRFEYYRFAESKKNVGWKNSIRHQLSLYACFVKREKERGEVGRGVWWTVDENADSKATKRQLKRGPRAPYECTEAATSRKSFNSDSQPRLVTVGQSPTYRRLLDPAVSTTMASPVPTVSPSKHTGPARSKPVTRSAAPRYPSSTTHQWPISNRLQTKSPKPLNANPLSTLTRAAGLSRHTGQKSEHFYSPRSAGNPVRSLPSQVYSAPWAGSNPLKFGRGAMSNQVDLPDVKVSPPPNKKGHANPS